MTPERAAEHAARHSYGRLVAYLAARSGDIAAAEDALSEALAAALQSWSVSGVPATPDAWLLTVARRRLHDAHRRAFTAERAVPELEILQASTEEPPSDEPLPDERLKLMFVCAHPAIDAGSRTPLMLQTVLGIDAARIAGAFIVSPATMSQRLVRAKRKIRDAGIRFEVPAQEALRDRLSPVLEAVYGAFGVGWDSADGRVTDDGDLSTEAVDLGRVLALLMPDEPEVLGLLSLMLHAHARRDARRDVSGRYSPLSEQDIRRWDRPLIDEAEQHLANAARLRRPGRFQTEAAIQSAYAVRVAGRTPDAAAIVLLHAALMQQAPTAGATAGYAAALGAAGRTTEGLQTLSLIDVKRHANFQPYWAVKADLHDRLGEVSAACAAYNRAIGLSRDAAVRHFLLERCETAQKRDYSPKI